MRAYSVLVGAVLAGVYLGWNAPPEERNPQTVKERIKVAVVDTGLDLRDPRFQFHLCEEGHRDFTGTGIKDVHGHGTHVAGIIKERATSQDFCLMILKYYTDEQTGEQNLLAEVEAFRHAAAHGATIVNFSGGGPEFHESEFLTIRDNPKVWFVVAAGNNGKNLDFLWDRYYPASYPFSNVITVGNVYQDGRKVPSSNYGRQVDQWEVGYEVDSTLPCQPYQKVCRGKMTGTSQATAIYTSKLIGKLKGVR